MNLHKESEMFNPQNIMTNTALSILKNFELLNLHNKIHSITTSKNGHKKYLSRMN